MQGVDVWLNTPRRPHEASGTSGMKAAANGVLNCSILDGWWVEGYQPRPSAGRSAAARTTPTPLYQDHVESQALYDILEKQIVPLFYKRGVDNIPREWIERMKNCMRKLAPVFNTNRMVRDYAEMLYVPALDRGQLLAADGMTRGRRAGAAPRTRCGRSGASIKIVGVHTSGNGHYKVGDNMQVEALVDLPDLDPERACRAALRRTDQRQRRDREPADIRTLNYSRSLAPAGTCSPARSSAAPAAGRASAVRVLPGNQDMATPFEPGLIIWN